MVAAEGTGAARAMEPAEGTGTARSSVSRRTLLVAANAVVWALAAVTAAWAGWPAPSQGGEADPHAAAAMRQLLGRKRPTDSGVSLVERKAAAEQAYRQGAAASGTAATRCVRTFQLGEDVVLQKGTQSQGSVPMSRWVRRNSRSLSYSHMPNVERLANGTLVVAWQAASEVEGATDQRIYFSLALDALGTSWGIPRRLPVPADSALWSPILHRSPSDGRLWLFYAESRDCMRPANGRYPARWVPGGDIKVTTTLTGAGGLGVTAW